MAQITRRAFLKGSAATAAALAFPNVCFGWNKVNRVVIVRFGGGVRYAETLGDPTLGNLPNLRKLMALGTVYTNLYNDGATSHVGGTLQILTGRECSLKEMDKNAPKAPTIFEYYRQAKGTRKIPNFACCALSHTALDVSYATSTSSEFGPNFGGVVFSPRLLMYEHLYRVMQSESDTTSDIYRQASSLRERIWVEEDFEHIEDPDRTAPTYPGKAGEFVTKVLQKQKVPVFNGGAVGDELVWYFAHVLMGTLAPHILLINFAGPDVAHRGSFSSYKHRIRALDWLVKEIYTVGIKKSKAYANNTLFIITPDCGRSLPGFGSGGFTSHRSGDDGCRHLWALAIGPGVKKGRRVETPCSQYDLAPTIGEVLGFSAAQSVGKKLPS